MFEMYSRKKKVIILVILFLIIVGIMVGGYFIFNKKDTTTNPAEQKPIGLNEIKVGAEENKVSVLPAPSVEEKAAASAKQIATMFAERFGTYTNQSNYESLADLSPLLTENMATWLEDTYIPQLKTEHDPNGYFYRITTLAPAVRELEVFADRLKLEVQTQRTEQNNDGEAKEFLQNLILDMVKAGDAWLVDGAFWKERR